MNHPVVMSGCAVEIELTEALERCVSGSSSDLAARVTTELTELAERLGVAPPRHVQTTRARSLRPVRFVVNGRIVVSSLAIARRTWLSSSPPQLRDLPLIDLDPGTGNPDAWLQDYASEHATACPPEVAVTIATYLALRIGATLSLHPSPLLTVESAVAYLDPLAEAFTPSEASSLLYDLLDMGLSLRARELIQPLAITCRRAGASLDAIAEEVFARLARPSIDIRVHPERLGESLPNAIQPTVAASGNGRTETGLSAVAKAVGDALGDLGLTRQVRFSSAEDPEPDQIWVQVNDRLGPPIPVTRPGELAVQIPPSAIRSLGKQRRPLIDAASGHQLVALDDVDAQGLRELGQIPLTPEAFLAVAIVRELMPMADRLIDINDVEQDLADAEDSHPDLVRAVLQRHSAATLTRVFRGLLAEQVPCRDVWAILNALLRYEAVPLPEAGQRLFDERVAVAAPRCPPSKAEVRDLVSFVRLQMKGPLVWQTKQPGTDRRILDAYGIDEELEAAMHRRMAQDHWTEHDDDEIRLAVGRTLVLAGAPADAAIVVAAAVRVTLREVLAAEFPSLRVLAWTEMAPETEVKVHSVARLS